MFSTSAIRRSWTGADRAVRDVWTTDSLRGRFARGAVWSLSGALVSQGSSLAASVIIARLLGRESFGEYGMIQSTAGMYGVFAGMGLGLTATKYVAEFRATNPERAGGIIALSAAAALGTASVAGLALFAAAPWLAASTLNAPHLAAELRIAAGVMFLNALTGAQTGVLAGFEAFRAIARVNVIRGALTLPLAVTGAALWNVRGAVLALIAAAAVGWLLNHLAIQAECKRNRVPTRWTRSCPDRALLWTFSVPAFLSGAATSPVMWAASSLLVNQPNGYAEMGMFSAANQWRAAVALLPSLLSQPLLPMLSNVAAGDARSFRRLVRANLLLNFGLSLLIATPIVVFSSAIMKGYGPDFLGGRAALILLVIATVISSTAAVVGQAIASLGRMWEAFALNCVWALVLLASGVLLVPHYGAAGLAGAFLISYSVHGLTVSLYARLSLGKRNGRADRRSPIQDCA